MEEVDYKAILEAFLKGVHIGDFIHSSSDCVDGFEDIFNYVVLAGQSVV